MFGKNKVNLEALQKCKEELEQIVEETAENSTLYEANSADIENSQKQMQVNMTQVSENIRATADQTGKNITEETNLSNAICELAGSMEISEKEYAEIVEQIQTQTEECMALVEENKHFTTPSKFIHEAPNELHGSNKSYLEALEQITEYSKQIGVLALNAAIEAGRMGENGKQFVTAAESIRSFTSNFDEVVEAMKKIVEESEKKIDELAEQSHHLVGLLKNNNVATNKLFKQNQRTVRMVEQASIRPFSGDIMEWKEQLTGIRNVEEEILKLQERSLIQVEDIESEIDAQKKASMELSDELIPMFGHAKEYREKKDHM